MTTVDSPKRKIPTKVKEPRLDEFGDSAEQESQGFASERDFEKESKENEHDRQETFRKHISRAALIVFWLLVGIAVCMAVSWAWHLMTPCRYLTEDQIDDIQKLSSGGLVAVLAGYLRQYIKQTNNGE